MSEICRVYPLCGWYDTLRNWSSLRFLRVKLQDDVNRLSAWLTDNYLRLNVSKTKVLLFNRDGLTPDPHIYINNDLVEMVSHFKFLGVTLDVALNFERHYEMIHFKLQRSSFIIRSLSRTLPLDCLKTLYFGYYHSHLSYCIHVWFPMLKKRSQDLLFKLQKRLIRNMNRTHFRHHCMPLFKKCNILTIQDQVVLDNVKLIHRISSGHTPLPIVNLFHCTDKVHDTRNFSIKSKTHRLAMLNKSFLNAAVRDWSKQPMEIKTLDNSKILGKKLRTIMLKNYWIVVYF